jgi:hypothetical protein
MRRKKPKTLKKKRRQMLVIILNRITASINDLFSPDYSSDYSGNDYAK